MIAYLTDTLDDVGEKSVHSLDLTLQFVAAEPHADSNGWLVFTFINFFLHETHLNTGMGKVLNDLTAWSLDSHNFFLNAHGN